MFKLNTKFDADSLLYLLSQFECDSYTVHMLTQWCLLLPLTSTVKSSLFTHAHSSPLSLAARLHRCHSNCSHHINNGWTFPGQTTHTHMYVYTHVSIHMCVYTCVFADVYTCGRVYAPVCVPPHVYTYTCVYTHMLWLFNPFTFSHPAPQPPSPLTTVNLF